jgi:hypothetical protein
MKLILLTVVGTAISAGCLLGFVYVSHSHLADVRWFLLPAYALATVGLFLWASRSLSLRWLIALGCSVAVLSDAAHQMLGFMFFPGLVKDLDPLEWDHISGTAVSALQAIGWYLIVAIAANLVMSRRRLVS